MNNIQTNTTWLRKRAKDHEYQRVSAKPLETEREGKKEKQKMTKAVSEN